MFDGSSPPAGGRDGERRILCSDHTKDGGVLQKKDYQNIQLQAASAF